MFKKLFNIQSLLWLALLLALIGSLRHVAWGFSTLEGGDIVAGYVQAVAVDLGLFVLAIGIQQRRRQKRSAWMLWIGVLIFAGLSTYANLLHGVQFKSDIDLSKWTTNVTIVSWLDFMRPLLLSAVLPILVVYLSEVAGSDTGFMLDATSEPSEPVREPSVYADWPERDADARQARIVQYVADHGPEGIAVSEVWDAVYNGREISDSSKYRDISVLVEKGWLRKVNGNDGGRVALPVKDLTSF